MSSEIETLTLPLHEELVQVQRRQVETRRVRVRVETNEHPELVEAELAHEAVEVTRVRLDRPIDAVPPIREEGGVTIIPVVEETLVVERRLILREEVHVKRLHTTSTHRETVMLRRQSASVEREPTREEPNRRDRVTSAPNGDTLK